MDTEKSILKKVATAIYNGDFNAFEQTILPLLNFEDADENNAPTTSNPDLSTLLDNFCDEDASYDENHLDLLEAPDPYFLCEWVDKTQDPSPCPDYDEWEWESIGGVRNAQELAYDDPMYDEHEALIEILYDKYADACAKAQQNEWLQAFYYQIREELNVNNVLFYPQGNSIDEDVSKFLHFLRRGKEGTFKGMLSRSEYKFLLQIKVDYEDALDQFKQSQLYRNAVMLCLGDQALRAFDDTFNAQYDPNIFRAVYVASENNVIEKLTFALEVFESLAVTAITKSDICSALCNAADFEFTYPSLDEIAQAAWKPHTIAETVPDYEQTITTKHEEKRPFDPSIFDRIVCAYKPPEERKKSTLSEDLQAAQAAANRQQQQAAPKAQSHNQKL